MPESSLDGQLLLFRAVERVGIKKYVAASWNFDWKNMNLGVHERYDAYIAFRNQVELSSDITPNYFFTRVLVEVLFSLPGHGDFTVDEQKSRHIRGPTPLSTKHQHQHHNFIALFQ